MRPSANEFHWMESIATDAGQCWPETDRYSGGRMAYYKPHQRADLCIEDFLLPSLCGSSVRRYKHSRCPTFHSWYCFARMAHVEPNRMANDATNEEYLQLLIMLYPKCLGINESNKSRMTPS